MMNIEKHILSWPVLSLYGIRAFHHFFSFPTLNSPAFYTLFFAPKTEPNRGTPNNGFLNRATATQHYNGNSTSTNPIFFKRSERKTHASEDMCQTNKPIHPNLAVDEPNSSKDDIVFESTRNQQRIEPAQTNLPASETVLCSTSLNPSTHTVVRSTHSSEKNQRAALPSKTRVSKPGRPPDLRIHISLKGKASMKSKIKKNFGKPSLDLLQTLSSDELDLIQADFIVWRQNCPLSRQLY